MGRGSGASVQEVRVSRHFVVRPEADAELEEAAA